MLSLPAHQVSNIIAVAGSGSPAGNMRSNELGFYNNSLDLPGGLRFVDQLLDVRPVPEPEAYAMLLAGLGLMGVLARRRRRVVENPRADHSRMQSRHTWSACGSAWGIGGTQQFPDVYRPKIARACASVMPLWIILVMASCMDSWKPI